MALIVLMVMASSGQAAGAAVTVTQQAKLTASDPEVDDHFGTSVAISGDVAVIGAATDDDVATNAGSAYVFVRSGSSWNQIAKLTANDTTTGAFFGQSVAIDGDTIAVGAPEADGAVAGAGAAYVFVRPAGGWSDGTEDAKLIASDGAKDHWFGGSVSVSGDTVAVGAYQNAGLAEGPGAVYVYEKPPEGWSSTSEDARLTASDGAIDDELGFAVAISGETLVAGARLDDGAGVTRAGSAYVFVRPTGGWADASEDSKLTALDAGVNAGFGFSVDVDEDAILVGSSRDIVDGTDMGSAYFFTRTTTSWTQQQKVTDPAGKAFDDFGQSVSVSGNGFVVGALRDDGAGLDSGAAHVFSRNGGMWTHDTELLPTDAASMDLLGTSVAMDGDTILISSHQDDDIVPGSGSVYVYVQHQIGSVPALSLGWLVTLAAVLATGAYLRLRRIDGTRKSFTYPPSTRTRCPEECRSSHTTRTRRHASDGLWR